MNKYVNIGTALVSCALLMLCGCNSEYSTDRKKIASDIVGSSMMSRQCNDYTEILLDEQYDMDMNEFESHVKHIRYVPLDGSKAVGEIEDAIINGDRLYILDGRGRQVLVYDLGGKLVRRIHSVGHARNEYLLPSAIFLDKEGRLYIKDGQQSKMLSYDRDGEFLSAGKSIPAMYGVMLDSVMVNQLAEGQSFDHDINYHIVTSVGDSVYSKCLPYFPIQLDYVMSQKLCYNSRGELLVHPVLSDTIYQIQSPYSYAVKYVLKDKHSVWCKRNERLGYSQTKDLLKGGGYRRMTDFYDVDNYCFLSLSYYSESTGSLLHHLIYDKREQRLLNVVGNTKEVRNVIPLNPIASSGNKCIAWFNPYMLKKHLQTLPDVKIVNDSLRDIVDNSKSSDNAVVVIYEMD